MEPLIDENETSEVTGLAKQTLRKGRMNPDFGLPFIKLGRRVFYRPEDVRAYVAARVRTSTSDTVAA